MLDFSTLKPGEAALFILALLVAYFIGNISPATLIAKAAGLDIRKEGSGNPGTTNVLRVLGKKAAVGTLAIDILKGVAAVWLGRLVGGEALAVFCGFFAFIGHVWPVVFRFKGGKGIATAFGVLLAVDPRVGLLCFAVAALGVAVSRRMSIGSVGGGIALPFLIWYFDPEFTVIFAVMAFIVVFRHRSNLKRIIKGEEPKLNFKK